MNSEIAPCEDANQPAYSGTLIRIFTGHQNLYRAHFGQPRTQSFFTRTTKTQRRLHGHSLGTDVRRYIFTWRYVFWRFWRLNSYHMSECTFSDVGAHITCQKVRFLMVALISHVRRYVFWRCGSYHVSEGIVSDVMVRITCQKVRLTANITYQKVCFLTLRPI